MASHGEVSTRFHGREVSCRATAIFIDKLESDPDQLQRLLSGVGKDATYLKNQDNRISWTAFCTLMRNAENIWAKEELISIGGEWIHSPLAARLSGLLRLFFRPADIYKWGARNDKGKANDIVACMSSTILMADQRNLILDIIMHDGYEICDGYFTLNIGGLETIPQLLGLPKAKVSRSAIRGGQRYLIKLPPGGGKLSFLKRIFLGPFQGRIYRRELEAANQLLYQKHLQVDEEIKKKEKERKAKNELEEQFQLLSEQTLLGICILQDNRIKYVNQALLDTLDRTREQLLNWEEGGFLNVVHKDDQPFAMDQAVKKQQGDPDVVTNYQLRLVQPDGSVRWGDLYSKSVLYKGRTADLVTIVDITDTIVDRRASEEHAQKSRAILRAIPDLMMILDKDGNILDTKSSNDRNLQITEKLIGRVSTSETPKITAFQDTLKHIQEALKTGELQIFTYEQTTRRGSHYYEVRIVPYHDNSVLAMVRDTTEQKTAEAELLRRNFELDSFVYRASHDLKSPLNSIMGLIQLIENEDNTDATSQYLLLVKKSVSKLDDFIRELTEFSRNERSDLNIDLIDFRSIIEESIQDLQYMEGAAHVRSIVEIDSDENFYSDRHRIKTIFNNLISNSVKYQSHGIENAFVKIKVMITASHVVIEISDNGQGIQEEYLPKIFDMFFRASRQTSGSGLGLYIVKQVVDKLNGQISAHSHEGKGTSFKIVLPNLKQK